MVCGLQVWLGFILPHPFYGFILRVAWVGPTVGLSWFIRWDCIEWWLLWMCVEGIVWRNGSTSSNKPNSRSGRQSSGGVRKINAGNVVGIERAGEPFILWLDSLGPFTNQINPSAIQLPPAINEVLGSDATWLQWLTGKWCRIKIIKKGINRLEDGDWPVKSNHPSLINSWANQVQVNLSQGSWLAQEKN